MECVAIDHPRFQRAQEQVFTRRVVVECLDHRCRMVKQGNGLHLDACCQHGVDVDLGERDGILARRAEIAELLVPEASDQVWFSTDEHEDVDFASGRYVRTSRFAGGCVFLAHDRRGCAIHRASVEGGWSFSGIKPHVCRLFPLTYTGDLICLSDDYADYSCSLEANVPTVYRAARDTLGEIFGDALITALDRAESAVRAVCAAKTVRHRLPVAP